MVQLKTIQIVVAPDGTSEVKTVGFRGGECREASRFIETALGQRQSERLTDAFYQSQTQSSDQSTRQAN